jgi:uncharacterized protein (TIGR02284 family)
MQRKESDPMNHQSNDILNDLVSATRDGQEFYDHAATKVKDPELRALFMRIARVKGDIVQGLSNEIRSGGDQPSTSGTWSGDFNRFYGEVRALISKKDFAYVAQLEESEDQLLKAFDKAMNSEETTTRARSVIAGFLPEVRECHDIMRARKIALKHAA